MEVRNITVREGLPTPTDIALYIVWMSPGNPPLAVYQTDIYLKDPTTPGGGGFDVGTMLIDITSGQKKIVIDSDNKLIR
jgi:hypothetical protein